MERLTSRDLRVLLDCVRGTYALSGLDDFSIHTVAALRRVFPSDSCTYSDYDLRRWTGVDVTDPPFWTEEARKAFERHMHEHPLVDYYRRTGDPRAYKVSDFVTRRQLHRLALYNEFVRRFFPAEYQLACTFVATRAHVVGVALGRRLKDFSERERLLLNLLRPHLLQAYENAVAVDGMATDLRRLRRGLDALDSGVVWLARDGRVRLATTRAREWLAAYFERRDPLTGGLPDELQRWAAAQGAALARNRDAAPCRAPLVVERGGRRLVARFVAEAEESVLLLEEQRGAEPANLERLGLTRREAEVLAWVTLGRTNAEVARLLGAKTRTVEKHLERIYLKLGVESRTAAAARAHALL